jgi:hypothetical protein
LFVLVAEVQRERRHQHPVRGHLLPGTVFTGLSGFYRFVRFLPDCPVFTGFTGLAPETNNKFLTDWSFGHCNADAYVCTKEKNTCFH